MKPLRSKRTRRKSGGFFRVLALLLVLIAAAWFWLIQSNDGRSNEAAQTAAPEPTLAPTSGPATIDSTESGVDEPAVVQSGDARDGDGRFPIPASARPAEVIWVSDGDSFDIRFLETGEAGDLDGERDEVRLQGIDTPEPGACFAEEAKQALIDLLKDQQVMVNADWTGGRFGDGRDEYFRFIADVWLGDALVNEYLVANGIALSRSSSGSYTEAIADAQRRAQQQELGIWSAENCGSATPSALTIVSIEADPPGRDSENPNQEWIEILNAGADFEALDGWTIRDESTRNRFSFPDDFVLAPGDSVVVRSGCGIDDVANLYWCAESPIWTNSGDTGYLIDASGSFADSWSY